MRLACKTEEIENKKKDQEKQQLNSQAVEQYFKNEKLKQTAKREELGAMNRKQIEEFREAAKKKAEAEILEAQKYNKEVAVAEEKDQRMAKERFKEYAT